MVLQTLGKCLLFLLLAGSGGDIYSQVSSTDNKLTAKERKEGWVLLFDGKSLDGWRNFRNRKADGWGIQNGELYCKMEGVTGRADLVSQKQYDNLS